MTLNFTDVLASTTRIDGGFALSVPETWHQGRTAFGGFSAAALLTAAMQVGGAGLPPLRSAALSFIGPVYGAIEARARILRCGKNATWASAELTRAGEVVASASFVFMGAVASAVHLNDCPPPSGLIVPDEARVFDAHALMPVFLKENFEVRFSLPKTADKTPELCWWARLKDRSGLDPMTEILLVGDALPPGVLPLLSGATPVSSMTWQANLLTAAPQTDDGWWLLQSRADYAENGCSSQTMRIWNSAGEPVVSGMQSIAVFG